MTNPWDGVNPFTGLPPNLIPNPPAPIPEAPGAGDVMASASPFAEPLDVDKIVKNLTLDRPLKLFIPGKERMPDWEFHIINSTPQELAAAHNHGWREVTDPEMVKLFVDLVAGTDKNGKAYRPILMARPKRVGEIIRDRQRKQLAALYAGMDPTNKTFDSKYAKAAGPNETYMQREGTPWRIRTRGVG